MKQNENVKRVDQAPCDTQTASLQELGSAFGEALNAALNQPGAKAAILAVDRSVGPGDTTDRHAARVTYFTEEQLRDPTNPIPKKLKDEALKDPPDGFRWAFIVTNTDGTFLAKISRPPMDFNGPLARIVDDCGGVLTEKLKAGAEVAVLLVDRDGGEVICEGMREDEVKAWLLEGHQDGEWKTEFSAHIDGVILKTVRRARSECPPKHGVVLVMDSAGGLLIGLMGLEPGPCKVVGCHAHAEQN